MKVGNLHRTADTNCVLRYELRRQRPPIAGLQVDHFRAKQRGHLPQARVIGVCASASPGKAGGLSEPVLAFLTQKELETGGAIIVKCLAEILRLEREKATAEKENFIAEKEKVIAEKGREEAIANLRVLRAENDLAVEVATNKTMDVMRDLGMLHARGVLEYAEMEQRRSILGKRPSRRKVWEAILHRKSKLEENIEAQTGWKMSEISGQIESLCRSLNGRMHRVADPVYTARSSVGIILQQGDPGSGLSAVQINALACICEAFFIRYTPFDANIDKQAGSAGINDPEIAKSWHAEQAERIQAAKDAKAAKEAERKEAAVMPTTSGSGKPSGE